MMRVSHGLYIAVALLAGAAVASAAGAQVPPCDPATHRQVGPETRSALLTLYHATGGEGWTNATLWGTRACACDWHGVGCSRDGVGSSVTELDLSGNNLSGEIPAELGNISSAFTLDLSDNRALSGTIPQALGGMLQLQTLDLHGCDLTGTIPESLGYGRQLAFFDVHDNALSGPLPMSIANAAAISNVDMSANQLSGTISQEWSIVQYTLNMSNNHLAGTLPIGFGAGAFQMYSLDLSNNDLVGNIPVGLSNLPPVVTIFKKHYLDINLSGNNLNPSVPPGVEKLCSEPGVKCEF